MRKAVVWTLAAASVMFMSSLALAQDEERPERAERERGARRERGERGERGQRGERGARRGERGGGPMQMNLLARALDADEDGVISAEELDNARRALLSLDTNDDGELTRDEYMPQRRGGGEMTEERLAMFIERMMERDENEDGKLSADELPERMAERMFERWDKNDDGFIDEEELTAMAKSRGGGMRSERGERGGRGSGPEGTAPRRGGRGQRGSGSDSDDE